MLRLRKKSTRLPGTFDTGPGSLYGKKNKSAYEDVMLQKIRESETKKLARDFSNNQVGEPNAIYPTPKLPSRQNWINSNRANSENSFNDSQSIYNKQQADMNNDYNNEFDEPIDRKKLKVRKW